MLVSVTHLRLRSVRFLPAFVWHAFRTDRQARRAPGVRSVRTRPGEFLAFVTLTTWDDEASMLAYRNSAAHGRAMPKLKVWCDTGSYARWEQPDDAPEPTRDEAMQRLRDDRVWSHVRRPAPDHGT